MKRWADHKEDGNGDPERGWEDNSYPYNDRSRLYSSIKIADMSFHIDALEVVLDEGNLMVTPNGQWDELLLKFYDAFGADGHFTTVKIEGRKYALFLSPFCE